MGGKERCAYPEMMTEKRSTRLEQEMPEADPGEGEGSVRQSWKLQQAMRLELGIDARVSKRIPSRLQKALLHGICTEGIAARYSGKLKNLIHTY